jgi:hypothetical protein
MCIGCAKATGGLQRVFEACRSMPPIPHDCGVRQRFALRPLQPGIAVIQPAIAVSAVTPAIESACSNASDASAGELRAKAKPGWLP